MITKPLFSMRKTDVESADDNFIVLTKIVPVGTMEQAPHRRDVSSPCSTHQSQIH